MAADVPPALTFPPPCPGPGPPRRAGLRFRYEPAGAARRLRRPRPTAPRSSPSAPTATASPGWSAPSAPGSRPSCAGSRDHADRAEWDAALAEATAAYEPDLVVSAGFMKIVGKEFLARFGGRFVNTHPALLPSFPGAHGVRDALAYGAKVTGCTVHFVDDGVDTGPIIAQGVVEVRDEDDEERSARAHQGSRAKAARRGRGAAGPQRLPH